MIACIVLETLLTGLLVLPKTLPLMSLELLGVVAVLFVVVLAAAATSVCGVRW